MTVRAVVFDIGGVLEHTPPTGWIDRWEADLGLEPGGLDRSISHLLDPGEVGDATYEQIQRDVADALSLDADASEQFWGDVWDDYVGRPNTALMDYVAGLRTRHRVALLSNSFVGAREREEAAHGLSRLCDVILYSHEAGTRKPDPAFYRLACEHLGVRPSETVFVDDHEPYVAGARALGMTAIRFISNAQAIPMIERALQGA